MISIIWWYDSFLIFFSIFIKKIVITFETHKKSKHLRSFVKKIFSEKTMTFEMHEKFQSFDYPCCQAAERIKTLDILQNWTKKKSPKLKVF